MFAPTSLTRDEWKRIGRLSLTAGCVALAKAVGEGIGKRLVDWLAPEDEEEEDPPQDGPRE